MKKIIICFGILFLICSLLQAYTQRESDEKLFQEAKILIFDEKWEKALEKLEELIEKYPESTWFSQALFYRAKCLKEQKEKEVEALNAYKDYIQLEKRNESLAEESEVSIIDLAYRLYERGKKSYMKEIERRLSSSNKVIKYYAAFKLSYVKDKKISSRGVPILKEIVRKERDDELGDRAKIALLRIDPDALKEFEEERYEKRARVLNIRVYVKGQKEPVFSLNIPWALADLALSAISAEDRALLREEGYDLDRIIKELTEFRGNIIEIRGKTRIMKMWID